MNSSLIASLTRKPNLGMTDHVVDASVALAYLLREPGWDTAEGLIARAFITSVNFSEIVAKLIDRGAGPDEAVANASNLDMVVFDADVTLAALAGALRAGTRHLGLSLGDRFCLALGRRSGLPVYTADRRWMDFSGSMDIRLIR